MIVNNIKENVVEKTNHTTNRLGGENRLIYRLKENNYEVICPNSILICQHIHFVKVFDSDPKYPTKKVWINIQGESVPINYYSRIHKKQRKMPYDKKIVGGGIPFYDGSVEFVNKL